MRTPGIRGQVLALAAVPNALLGLALLACGQGVLQANGDGIPAEVGLVLLGLALATAAGTTLFLARAVLRTVRTLVDQGERARAEATDRADLTARTAHDLRTALDGVLGYSRLLGRTALDPGQRGYLASVQRAAGSLLDRVSELLEISGGEQVGAMATSVELDLRRAVEETLDLFAPAAYEKGLELVAVVDAEIPARVRGNPRGLSQTLLNLVSNAVKFTTAGTVAVEVSPAVGDGPSGVRFTVTDTGGGMPRVEQARGFRPYGAQQGRLGAGGPGLGLVIAHSLVERMGGQIHVRSTPGKGTSVSFMLPLEPAGESQDVAAEPLAGRTALVLEENLASRRALEGLLRAWGVAVTEVADPKLFGEEAGTDQTFDFVLLGLPPGRPPPFPWPETLDRAARLARHPPVVLVPLADSRALALPPGVLQSAKPVRHEQLHQALLALLASPPAGEAGLADNPASVDRLTLPEGARVLLAEDNLVSQQLVRALLESDGATVTVVGNGREALARTLGEGYDLVILDLHLPEMDGLEVTARVRAVEGDGAHVPIIALTGDALADTRSRAFGAGVDDWLTKPVDETALLEVVRRFLARAPAGSLATSRASDRPAPVQPPVIDRAAAIAIAGGQAALADELLEMLLAELPEQQGQIAAGLAAGDLAEVAEVAHKLAGGAAYCGATALERAARELLQAARADDLEAAAARALTLEHEAGRVVTQAARHLPARAGDPSGAHPGERGPG